ncbi:MAG: bifunctional 4-hydroxy-3-methylbut-2-enyl diphosphate reductase/30S ribosomal protein S1 [Firmicutes bacterium]|nr:bifunctional 4-hydroxy-3-methylbut-2-enyl diphosphate reductase/30S ribosomal protein S1 [Bacillota bacterium]
MEIILAKTAGFCFGVNNAIKTIFNLLEYADKKIYTLGPIIHNQPMVDYLKTLGVIPVDNIDSIEPPAYVIIRAHGVGQAIYEDIEKRGLTLVDATCPYVKKIHNLVRDKYNEGYKIIIAGDKEHPEVIGINGWCNNQAIIVNNVNDLYNLPDSDERVFASAQTTFSYENWLSIVETLKTKFKNMEKQNTICNATTKRQKEAEELSKEVDMMLVLGGKDSSNTQKLFEICKMNCPRTYKIETPGDLPPVNIKEIKKVGITAGASTPDWIIKEVLNKMEKLNKQENELSFKEAFESSMVRLKAGEVVKGKVISIGENEVFIDLGYKSDGIIPFEEISADPNVNPEQLFKPGMEIDVFIEKVNDGEGNVLLSKKKVDYIKGWDMLEEAYKNRQPVKATVVEVVNGGIIAVTHGIRIFVPASQVSDRYVKDLNEFIKQQVSVRIIEFNRNKNRVVGSQRVIIEEEKERLSNELWSSIEVGKKYTGKVRNLTNFGAFVDIGGVDGLIHLSELSWYKIKHPSEVLNIGEEVEVTVLEYDKEKKKISLGYRKPEDNPWNKVAKKYKVGDVVEGTVVRLVPFGCFVEIEESIDGLVHISQISNKRIAKPDDVLKVGQKVEAKIIEMDLENKKIGLSIKEVNPINPVEKNIKDEKEKENENEAETDEETPTEHKEELSVKLGEVLGNLDLNKTEIC